MIQDIQTYDSSKLNHSQPTYEPPIGLHDYAHKCNFVHDSILYSIFNETHLVNSFHHQAIKNIANGFKSTAYSEDGLIEGIENKNIIAVQWHPERLTHDEAHLHLAKYFIQECIFNLKY